MKKKNVCGTNSWMVRVGAVLLAALLLWWLYWAILADEDANELNCPSPGEIIDAVE